MSMRLFAATAGAVSLLSVAVLTSWHATINAVGSSGISGSADIEPAMAMAGKKDDGTSYRASITILGAKPGSVHHWHVHSGKCGSNGGVVGPANVYKPITVDKMGGGSASAVVPVKLDPKADYHVNVHAAGGDDVVACGDLAMSGDMGH